MPNQELNSLDDFERFASSTISPWSREKRIALAAAMAERWLPVYESFSEQEEWGDASTFQRAVQAVWNSVLGHTLTPKDLRLHKKRVGENTPHVDDFDCEEAIATSGMIDYALNCCVSADNTNDAVMAMVSGFEAVAPDIYTEAEKLPPDAWPQVKDMLKNEVKPLIDNAPAIDEQEIDALRQQFSSLRAWTPDGIGPLPSDVWESPEVQDHLESVLKLRKAMPDIVPMLAQQIEAIRQEYSSPETEAQAEQAARNLWQLPQVQDELKKQLKLLKLIGDMDRINEQEIKALRQKLVSPDLVGTVAPRPEPSRGMTNEAIFDQYRHRIEIGLRNRSDWEDYMRALGDNTGAVITSMLSEWAARYARRKDAIKESPMLDVDAHRVLVARNFKRDEAVLGDPSWDEDTSFFINTYYASPWIGFEVNSPEKPHSYGPSLRRLWIEASLAANSDKDRWNSIVQWAHRRPSAWEEEDRRKKKKLAYASPGLGEHLSRNLDWRATNDVDHPWATEVAGETWRVRLNDFPDDLMYTLIINDTALGSFHDWPESWHR